MTPPPAYSNTVRWVLEINLWLWVALFVYVAAVRRVSDRHLLMAAGGLFIAAAAQFIYARLLRRRR